MVLYSMTGYGTRNIAKENLSVQVTIQSLNSKTLDVHIESNWPITPYRQFWHQKLGTQLHRGKIDMTITFEDTAIISSAWQANAIKARYHFLDQIAKTLKAQTDPFRLAVQSLPQSNPPKAPSIKDELPWINTLIQEVIQECIASRANEGKHLTQQLDQCLTVLQKEIIQIQEQALKRKTRLRSRLKEKIHLREGSNLEASRWEQEISYFLDKMDITEEHIRLQSHLAYFKKTLKKGDAIGKTLGFILQEMGREVNTIGAKAQDAMLQHTVITIKEILEAMKEQVRNVL